MVEQYHPVEINGGKEIYAMAFTANGEHLLGGNIGDTLAWHVEDGKEVAASIKGSSVKCFAMSSDGKWIAAGMTVPGHLVVWDAQTGERIMKQRVTSVVGAVADVDFSPDGTHLVAAANNRTVTVWSVATTKQVHTLDHGFLTFVKGARYSPRGDRIATITRSHLRVWDSGDASLIRDIDVGVRFEPGLLWRNDHLFVASPQTLDGFDSSTGSVVSRWQLPDPNGDVRTEMPKHEGFIACSTGRAVTFWHPSSHAQLGIIEHPEEVCSITFSPDGQLFAIGGKEGKVSIHRLSHTSEGDLLILSTIHHDAETQYTPPTPSLREWASTTLKSHSWKEALHDPPSSKLSVITIYQVLCEHLESIDRIPDAIECLQQMASGLGGEANLGGEHLQWALELKERSCKKLEHFGDTAMDAQRHDEAISHFSVVLSLNPSSPQDVFIKRSRAYIAIGSWKQALDGANQVITLDPSMPWGYEIKHAALHKAGDYENAIAAFEVMMSKMEGSPDPDVQQRGDQYISPSSTRAEIRKLVQKTVRRLPLELINTTDGRLYNRGHHTSVFESLPIFNKLVSSMTKRTDYVRIKREVRQYFRYVMLSHKWEDDEPSFQQVTDISVYDLEKSPTHDKLQTFCKIVLDAGIIWAWSDTCCINKSDHFVLQEALVAMFRWYQGSILTIVYLRGVHPLSVLGALVNSIWNTRAWTLQEYIAAKVVHFYTEDWTIYLDLKLSNHKKSPEVISEMEQCNGYYE